MLQNGLFAVANFLLLIQSCILTAQDVIRYTNVNLGGRVDAQTSRSVLERINDATGLRTTTTGQQQRPASCPSGCSCQPSDFSGASLAVDCRRRSGTAGTLSDEIDAILSDWQSDLTSLTINNSPLTSLPATVCQLTKLTSLNLDNNKLTALPDNCVSRMRHLQVLSAMNNSIVHLQVSMAVKGKF